MMQQIIMFSDINIRRINAMVPAAAQSHVYHGKYLIINKGKTKMEGKADLVFQDSIGKVLGYM